MLKNEKKIAWILGILDGDRAGKTIDGIGISNQDPELIKKFMDISSDVFHFDKDRFIVDIIWYNKEVIEDMQSVLKLEDFQIRFYKPSKKGYKQNKPQIRAIFYDRKLSRKLIALKQEYATNNLPALLWYVRGISDSDGGFVKNNICIQQRFEKLDNMKIIENILNSFGIENGGIRGPDCKNMLRIYIHSNEENLKKYSKLIGFYSFEKLRKLRNLIA